MDTDDPAELIPELIPFCTPRSRGGTPATAVARIGAIA